MPSTNSLSSQDQTPKLDVDVAKTPQRPVPPMMRVVTKGWWVLREEHATVDELERAEAALRR